MGRCEFVCVFRILNGKNAFRKEKIDFERERLIFIEAGDNFDMIDKIEKMHEQQTLQIWNSTDTTPNDHTI